MIAPKSFFSEYFLSRREKINDSQCHYFEHVLYDSIVDWKKAGGRHRMYWTPPKLEGMSGTHGTQINSTISGSQLLRYRIMYILRQYFCYRGYENPFYHGKPKKY